MRYVIAIVAASLIISPMLVELLSGVTSEQRHAIEAARQRMEQVEYEISSSVVR